MGWSLLGAAGSWAGAQPLLFFLFLLGFLTHIQWSEEYFYTFYRSKFQSVLGSIHSLMLLTFFGSLIFLITVLGIKAIEMPSLTQHCAWGPVPAGNWGDHGLASGAQRSYRQTAILTYSIMTCRVWGPMHVGQCLPGAISLSGKLSLGHSFERGRETSSHGSCTASKTNTCAPLLRCIHLELTSITLSLVGTWLCVQNKVRGEGEKVGNLGVSSEFQPTPQWIQNMWISYEASLSRGTVHEDQTTPKYTNHYL